MNSFDCVVIGGGLLGCFTARALTRYQLKVALVERCPDVGMGISRANTAIVYSGYDTRPGSFKSRLCLEGNARFADLCAELGVRFKRCGSLMICLGPRGEVVLRQKYRWGQESGVPGLRLLSGSEVLQREPQLNPAVRLGLWAPTSGTVDPCELTVAAYENALANGCRAFLATQVNAIRREQGEYLLETSRGTLRARAVVNCAGLFADRIYEMVAPPEVRIYPSRGAYYLLDEKMDGFIRHIIFHQPERKGKGLTIVPTVTGNLLLGPSEQPWGEKDNYATTEKGLAFLDRLAHEVVPQLPLQQQVIRNFGALRPSPYYVRPGVGGLQPQLQQQVSGFELARHQQDPTFFSFLGIKTPGLTCAAELGNYAAEAVSEALGISSRNPDYDPRRQALPRLKELPLEQRADMIAANPLYGNIVCRCREISEGEIVDAIQRGARTINGIKRRTGAGGGRCQGSYCQQRMMELLSRELGMAIDEVTLDGAGSELIRGRLREEQHGD